MSHPQKVYPLTIKIENSGLMDSLACCSRGEALFDHQLANPRKTMPREEVLYNVLRYVRDMVKQYFLMQGRVNPARISLPCKAHFLSRHAVMLRFPARKPSCIASDWPVRALASPSDISTGNYRVLREFVADPLSYALRQNCWNPERCFA
jgi:hypothetical protein